MEDSEVTQQVRQFYDRIGWQVVSEGMYQNARYEDLRPVSHEYIHRCHLRVGRYLKPTGSFLLDAGSGPVQYPEYLTYSYGYKHRVCLDISLVALQEARKRLGEHGLFVVADVAALPFKDNLFDGTVSLHTLHHLPSDQQKQAYRELIRTLKTGSTGVVVNGWTESPLMRRSQWLVTLMERLGKRFGKQGGSKPALQPEMNRVSPSSQATGTYIQKRDAAWLQQSLTGYVNFEIRSWRSVSVRFLRAMIHTRLGGKYWLRLLFKLEDRYPRYFGENGQYPLVILKK
jgi:ubiquinone/menaquinone biosynthesis C-methylase UbiE